MGVEAGVVERVGDGVSLSRGEGVLDAVSLGVPFVGWEGGGLSEEGFV